MQLGERKRIPPKKLLSEKSAGKVTDWFLGSGKWPRPPGVGKQWYAPTSVLPTSHPRPPTGPRVPCPKLINFGQTPQNFPALLAPGESRDVIYAFWRKTKKYVFCSKKNEQALFCISCLQFLFLILSSSYKIPFPEKKTANYTKKIRILGGFSSAEKKMGWWMAWWVNPAVSIAFLSPQAKSCRPWASESHQNSQTKKTISFEKTVAHLVCVLVLVF